MRISSKDTSRVGELAIFFSFFLLLLSIFLVCYLYPLSFIHILLLCSSVKIHRNGCSGSRRGKLYMYIHSKRERNFLIKIQEKYFIYSLSTKIEYFSPRLNFLILSKYFSFYYPPFFALIIHCKKSFIFLSASSSQCLMLVLHFYPSNECTISSPVSLLNIIIPLILFYLMKLLTFNRFSPLYIILYYICCSVLFLSERGFNGSPLTYTYRKKICVLFLFCYFRI